MYACILCSIWLRCAPLRPEPFRPIADWRVKRVQCAFSSFANNVCFSSISMLTHANTKRLLLLTSFQYISIYLYSFCCAERKSGAYFTLLFLIIITNLVCISLGVLPLAIVIGDYEHINTNIYFIFQLLFFISMEILPKQFGQ